MRFRDLMTWVSFVLFALFIAVTWIPSCTAMIQNNFEALELVREWKSTSIASESSCAGVLNQPEHKITRQSGSNWVMLGRLQWLSGDCQGAVQSWEYARNIDPTHAIARIYYAVTGYPSLLVAVNDNIVSKNEAGAFAKNLGIQIDETGNVANAKRWYEQAVLLKRDEAVVEKLSYIFVSEGKPEEAAVLWMQLSTDFSNTDALHWWALGRFYELNSEWELGTKAYLQASELVDIAEKEKYLVRAAHVAQYVDMTKSRYIYTNILTINPNSLWAMLGMGHTERNLGHSDEALNWYLQAESEFPNDINPKFHLGTFYESRKQPEIACTYFEEALSLNNNHTPSLDGLVRCRRALYQLDASIAAMFRAIHSTSMQNEIRFEQLGDMYLEQEDPEAALVAYQQALALGNSSGQLSKKLQFLLDMSE